MYCSFCNKDITDDNGTILTTAKNSDDILFRCCVECQSKILILVIDRITTRHYEILFRKFK